MRTDPGPSPIKLGTRFGEYTVKEYAGQEELGGRMYLCVCKHGGRTLIRRMSLLKGKAVHCGCVN